MLEVEVRIYVYIYWHIVSMGSGVCTVYPQLAVYRSVTKSFPPPTLSGQISLLVAEVANV